MTRSTFSNTHGSFSLTQASLEAVKLPGEFSNDGRLSCAPSDAKAASPYGTARLSHQIMLLRNTCCSLSTTTRPCIWYAMPIARMFLELKEPAAAAFLKADFVCAHQSSGGCSAQPGCG